MRFDTLQDWLAFQERLHPHGIELGLERVTQVRDALGLERPPFRVITVGGTNGKGSCVAWLTAMLRERGLRVGAYTSPHLLRYNERVVVDGVEADDAALCAAFEAVDRARGDLSLTYFEFGTLAALHHFREAACEVAVLEVGMGGRLDATNAFEPDAAVVVSVGIDHTEWLGADREEIGYEKAGIFRRGRAAVCADPSPPHSLVAHAEAIGAHLVAVGVQYRYEVGDDGTWAFHGLASEYHDLPRPNLGGWMQYGNAAAALAVLDALPDLFPPDRDAVARALRNGRLRGRFERIAEDPETVVDVAHNPEGARMLARQLAASPVPGRHIAVCAMLADKQVEATVAALDAEISHWIVAGLEGPRTLTAEGMLERVVAAGLHGSVEACADLESAFARARALAGPGDRIVVFGSFLVVGAALELR